MKHSMGHENPYIHFGIMVVLSFIAMYVLMYSMVNVLGNVYPNFNQLYMAALMTSPMVVIELLFMRKMYPNKKVNIMIMVGGIIAMIIFFALIRIQALVGDEEFLKSMIPHHASAILMCEKASVQDPQIQELCRNIVSGQQGEIEWMKKKLSEL